MSSIDAVQSLWIGGRLSPLQQLSIKSFLAHGHSYHLYAYDEVAMVPEGTLVRDATDILPRDSIFCYQQGFGKGSYSAFSNVFRYQLVLDRGGWWVDTDLVCLKAFDFDDEFVFATEREEDQSLLTATCAFRSPAGSPYLEECLRVCASKDRNAIQWSEIGPYLFDEAVRGAGLTRHQVATAVFNPVHYFDFRDIVAPAFDLERLAHSHAVHLWHQMWNTHGVDPDPSACPGSLYATLWSQYAGAH